VHLCYYKTDLRPSDGIFFAVIIDKQGLSVADKRFHPIRNGLKILAQIDTTGIIVYKYSGVPVADRTAADKKNVIFLIYRLKMAACYHKCAIYHFAVAVSVGRDIYLHKIAGIVEHAVVHISGGDEHGDKIIRGEVGFK
jgi:hypothetical protein